MPIHLVPLNLQQSLVIFLTSQGDIREKLKQSTMGSCFYPDLYTWIQNLLPVDQWKTGSMSICICSSTSSQPSLNLCATRSLQTPTISFSVIAYFNLPITLWSSKPLKINSGSPKVLDEESVCSLMTNFIQSVLNYGSNYTNNSLTTKFPKLDSPSCPKDVFNLSFLSLALLICIYEAPADLRPGCLNAIKNQLLSPKLREASTMLMKLLGSNLEEKWMRSINLAITSWIAEVRATTQRALSTPSSLFSYPISTSGLWKVQLYCPVIAMDFENFSHPPADERLMFSLNYHQLEGVIQFNHKVVVQEKWVSVLVNIDNIRCDIIRLVNDKLINEQGVGAGEKHFPSRIKLQITPILQSSILSVSVSKSSDNPTWEIGVERGLEGSFDPPTSLGLRVSAGETVTTTMKPWKFEQSVYGNSGILNWFLHDFVDGREVFSSKPSKFALLNPRAWFKDRYSSAYRPFTRQGGVVFAGDEYGESVLWKVDRNVVGQAMEWEIRGWIWVTYWPNKYKTFYSETRKLEFKEIVRLNVV